MKYTAAMFGLTLMLSLTCAFAQEQDAEGCKDSPLIQRMPGSAIHSCEHKEFDSVQMPVGKNADGDPVTKDIEGEKWYWDMGNREGLSDVQVYRNFLNALRVEGHTDNQGSAAANQALSEKRAQAVVAWLTSHGVAAARLTAKGFGQTKPVADNAAEEGRAKNRRVELAKQ